MLVTARHVLITSLVAAVAAGLVVTPLLLLSAGFDLEQAVGLWPAALLAPLVSGLSVAAVVGLLAWQSRRSLDALTTQIRAARRNPSRGNLTNGPLNQVRSKTLGALHDEVGAICSSYRQAIADRVKQREALDALQARLKTEESADRPRGSHRAPGASRNMVARLTPNLRWMNATPALQRFLGAAISELNGRAFLELVSPKYAAALSRTFEAALQSGEAHNVFFRFQTRRKRASGPNGPARVITEHRYVQMDVLTRYSDEGQALHFRCYFEDITERVRAERKLRGRTQELIRTNERLVRINEDLQRLKESYRDLYHNAPIIFFTLDALGRFVACNDTMIEALGYRREDLHEQSFTRLLTPEGVEAWERIRLSDAGGARPHLLMADGEVEMQWVKHDGTVIDVWIRSIPLQDAEGRFVRSRSAAHDITQRNRLANELRRRGDELEQANADLRTINKELDEFTRVVAHDLKEPLRTLEAYSNLLAEEYASQLGPDGFECINYMLMASRRQGKLIDELLTLSRAGRIATTPRVFHLNEAVAIVRRDLGDMILRRNATFAVEGSLPTVVGDLERVTQLLTNLIANGLKYNSSAQPAVVLGEAERCDQAGFVALFVRDNGIGIDPKFHKEIFGVFRRLHRKDEYEGTGTGLAICKKILQAHGGKIWVESAPGQGTAFYFTLPRAPQSVTAPLAAPPVGRAVNGSSAVPTMPADLLLVEDMPEMGLIVQRLARKAGHNLQWVKTAEEAWEHLQRSHPDLVLLDIHLPGMDGIELCRRLRAQPQHAELPIALFSHGAEPEDISEGLSAGANYVLSKELLCQPESWRQRLAEVLQAVGSGQ